MQPDVSGGCYPADHPGDRSQTDSHAVIGIQRAQLGKLSVALYVLFDLLWGWGELLWSSKLGRVNIDVCLWVPESLIE